MGKKVPSREPRRRLPTLRHAETSAKAGAMVAATGPGDQEAKDGGAINVGGTDQNESLHPASPTAVLATGLL
jgi:hypothetical protein